MGAWRVLCGGLLFLSLLACSPADNALAPGSGASLFARASTLAYGLPNRLREISGLAYTRDGRLFAHGDERAEIYQIDLASGAIPKSFSVGDPVEHGDFEDIAITPQGDFWLMSSHGYLLRFREGADGAHVPFERFETGLKDICELEGLAYLASAQSLILACKVNHTHEMRHTLALYSWPISGNADATLWRSIPVETVTAAAGIQEFRPSAVKIDPATGRILLLSARDGALAELSPDGQLLAARRLGSEHVQAEGLEVAPDGSLVISDEANGGQARIAVYGRLQ